MNWFFKWINLELGVIIVKNKCILKIFKNRIGWRRKSKEYMGFNREIICLVIYFRVLILLIFFDLFIS